MPFGFDLRIQADDAWLEVAALQRGAVVSTGLVRLAPTDAAGDDPAALIVNLYAACLGATCPFGQACTPEGECALPPSTDDTAGGCVAAPAPPTAEAFSEWCAQGSEP